MTKRYFITGTDTDIGKTYVTCLLLQNLAAKQHRVLGIKPLGLGVKDVKNDFRHLDAVNLLAASNIQAEYQDVNPYLFPPFSAPHIALEQANSQLSAQDLIEATNNCIAKYQPDYALIEGVGGFTVPLTQHESMIDVAKGVAKDVILVVGLRLGCLNHTLLTYQAIHAAGMNCAYWVANEIDPEMLYKNENIELLKTMLPVPYLGRVSYETCPQTKRSVFEIMI